MPEAAFPAIRRVEGFDLDPLRPNNWRDDELSDSIAALDAEFLRPGVHQDYLNLAAIVRVDRTRTVGDEYAMPQRQPAARPDLRLETHGQRDVPAGGNQTAFSCRDHDGVGHGGPQIESRRCLGGGLGQR